MARLTYVVIEIRGASLPEPDLLGEVIGIRELPENLLSEVRWVSIGNMGLTGLERTTQCMWWTVSKRAMRPPPRPPGTLIACCDALRCWKISSGIRIMPTVGCRSVFIQYRGRAGGTLSERFHKRSTSGVGGPL